MATYVYETIPQKEGDVVRRFEVRQSMKDEPLTRDPETGLPVKRVILGGFGIMTKSAPAGGAGECASGECAMPAGRGARHVCTSPFCCQN
jgi:predicted nucleic acid-binding Zn ribbon protein